MKEYTDQAYQTMLKVRKMTEAMDKVVETLAGKGLDKKSLRESRKELELLGGMLGTTEMETILFLSVMASGPDTYVYSKDIAELLGVSSFKMLELYQDLKHLVSKRFISESRSDEGGFRYRVTTDALTALREGRGPEGRDISGLTSTAIFSRLYDLFKAANRNNINMGTAMLECNELFGNNSTNTFVQRCGQFGINKLNGADRLAAFYMLHRALAFSEDEFSQNELKSLMDGSYKAGRDPEEDFLEENSGLFDLNLVEYRNDDGRINDNVLVLTREAKERLLKGYMRGLETDGMVENVPEDELIRAAGIRPKQLFFNEKEQEQLDRVAEVLEEENYSKLKERMEEEGFSSGFTALFHGVPGTGKTASVFELARRCGRDLWFVDQSKLRSKWHGESEKALRSLFHNYREAVHQSERCPILVLNECDSLMYNRLEKVESSNDQLNNSMINIILNELDNFEGILICTSNMTEGLDPAFERRMLFKIRFEEPSEATRRRIWESKMKSLDGTALGILSHQYRFTGGQIDNVARKASISYVLTGKRGSLETMRRYCEEERLNPARDRKIGF